MKYSVSDLKKAIDLITKGAHDDNVVMYEDAATNHLVIKYNDPLKTDPITIIIPQAESGKYAKITTTERL